jgi:hypothetical protein
MNINELNEEKIGEVLTYLARTDDEYAMAKADLERSEILRKRVRSRVFLSEEGTVAERQAEAEVSEDTQAADDAYISALGKFEALKAKRQRGELIVDVFRTLEASRRRVSV